MKTIQCVAVDDEPLALDIIQNFCSRLPNLSLLCFNSPLQAKDYLQSHSVDLLFLDINMPELMGLDLAAALDSYPPIIFTTAYAEYAIDSFEYNTVSYLLKPYNFERFEKAIQKALPLMENKKEEQSITLKVDYRNVVIPTEKILYIEAMGNYLKIYTDKQCYLPQMTMKAAELILNPQHFKRIHRSYIVNLDAVESFNRSEVHIGGHILPLGKAYSDTLAI